MGRLRCDATLLRKLVHQTRRSCRGSVHLRLHHVEIALVALAFRRSRRSTLPVLHIRNSSQFVIAFALGHVADRCVLLGQG